MHVINGCYGVCRNHPGRPSTGTPGPSSQRGPSAYTVRPSPNSGLCPAAPGPTKLSNWSRALWSFLDEKLWNFHPEVRPPSTLWCTGSPRQPTSSPYPGFPLQERPQNSWCPRPTAFTACLLISSPTGVPSSSPRYGAHSAQLWEPRSEGMLH